MSQAPLLVIEPYYGGSHRAWADGMVAHLDRPVELMTLPARWWKWRMRGAAVTLAHRCHDLTWKPWAIVVSDMLDLAAFRGLIPWADVPIGLYFHESQLTYPDSPQMEPDEHFAYLNWQSALAADRVFFNSRFHRDLFLGELPRFLRRFPDHRHGGLVEGVAAKSEVLEVGVDLAWTSPKPSREGPLRVLWNHRWEHDKDPAAFFMAIDRLAASGNAFELVVMGENFRNRPAEFEAGFRKHGSRITHFGHLPVEEYRSAVLGSDVVISTARQEFFGISVVEATSAGCFPLLPDRLSYPELIPREFHSECLYEEGRLGNRLIELAEDPPLVRGLGLRLAPHMQRFDWSEMRGRYEAALQNLGQRVVESS